MWNAHTQCTSVQKYFPAQSSVWHRKASGARRRQAHKLQSSHIEWTNQHSMCIFLVFMVLQSLWHRSKGCFRQFNMLFKKMISTYLPLFFFIHSVFTSNSWHLLSLEALIECESVLLFFTLYLQMAPHFMNTAK